MRIWGKVFGFIIGFMFGRIFGAFLGLWLGHLYDKRQGLSSLIRQGSERQAMFFNATFAVMGHVAKASGRVTENDIRIATMLMDQMKLSGQSRLDAQQAFRQGRQADFDLAKQLEQFRHVTQGRAELAQMFLEIQIQTALSDGELHANEKQILSTIANKLGMASQLDALLARWQAEFSHHQSPQGNKMPLTDAYVMLGLADSASDQDIKRAYRKLMNEHHPDKLVAKGLPEEMMALAKTKAQDIQAAYERIKTARGMR
ncbi:co-chaperone DjlA [Shewanella inventionis]|uniref:Co-chaperone protein DjlA n=1 Tax=Shewanella inventionis TaxID=1738770 RepID=A0ABQ1JA86_9GAMM|nr:co-chaperone DjlA [Shewanella inventionis]MCL1158696.1 co-chaperone DjlA [Shewanella inventionis]UAL42884.1 co-chaperone DjlA [Shewanella inventionis]GGB61396.1 co-chaperone protein DjlA [Shewanella inventionis]